MATPEPDGPNNLGTIRAREDPFQPGISRKTHDIRPVDLYVAGRITSIRRSGRKLVFIDVCREQQTVQVVLNIANLPSDVTEEQFQRCAAILRRGDHISAHGFRIGRAKMTVSSLAATELPVLEAPCLERFPVEQPLSERDTSKEFTAGRHVEMLTFPAMITTLKVRAKMLTAIRLLLDRNNFIEVQTPILSAAAGGASARPFMTTATEFSDRKLALRIAPELWLKRLIVGGADQVYEIGPSFRNEGLDRTHNPEFTTCEFYAAYLNIERLILFTERIFNKISSTIKHMNCGDAVDDELITAINLAPGESFPQIDFIPAINEALEAPLPALDSPTAVDEILSIFEKHSITVPSPPTLPRLLDKLSSHFLEPQCHEPTWIINIPECLSPLSKSFVHPTAPNNQPVAARAELYIRGKEIVNCYEEENSPFEQRRKFEDQQRYSRDPKGQKVDDEAMQVDEDYISALEWGLPPTGGWGCGIDRLVMLITKQDRIGDVLSFGNLRAVTRGADKVTQKEGKKDEQTRAADKVTQKEGKKDEQKRPRGWVPTFKNADFPTFKKADFPE